MGWTIFKAVIAAVIIVAVSELGQRLPRVGGLLLSLPIISILAFLFTWFQYHDTATISRLSRETLVLVPLCLPFFIPLGFADRWGLGFWQAMACGVALASVGLGLWLWLGPQSL